MASTNTLQITSRFPIKSGMTVGVSGMTVVVSGMMFVASGTKVVVCGMTAGVLERMLQK